MSIRLVEAESGTPRATRVPAQDDPAPQAPAGVDNTALRAFVERISRLHEERKAIADDISDIYDEAKGQGYDKQALKTVVAVFGDPAKRAKRRENAEIVEIYCAALGLS